MRAPEPKPIKQYALGIYDGPHATPKESSKGAVYLGIKNLTPDGRLDFSEVRYISEEDLPKWIRRVEPRCGDVVFTYEATLHRYAVVPEDFRGCLGRRVALFRPNPDMVDSRYLLYYFLSHQWRKTVEGYLITGATVDRIPIERFPEFPVVLPNLTLQKQVADTLSAYDDLIENNRRRMALLEESARLLYQEWFVRLRFPGHEHNRIIDGVPEGWEPKVLGDLCTEVRDIVVPQDLEPDTPYIGLEHMPRRSISLSEWGKSDQVMSTKHRFRKGEILFGKIRPYFHKVGIAFVDGVASSDAIILQPLSDHLRGLVLMTVSSDQFVAEASQTMREGSKMPRADWKLMRQYAVAVPPDGLVKTFNETISNITSQLKVLTFQNQKLRQARDLLLPRLMSGEIAI